jgi:tRNA-specific 2-thiouridylase
VEGGSFVDRHGNIIGRHRGYPFYTIGQRKGLDIALGKPVYVTAIHPENNTVVLGEESDLAGQSLMVGGLNLMKYDAIPEGMESLTKIRYKDKGCLSNLYPEGGQVRVQFYEPVKSIAPGQSAVFYEGDDVVGGGIIGSHKR